MPLTVGAVTLGLSAAFSGAAGVVGAVAAGAAGLAADLADVDAAAAGVAEVAGDAGAVVVKTVAALRPSLAKLATTGASRS